MHHTFCIVAYGQSPFLRNCIESILAQTRRDSEVVLSTSTPSEFLTRLAGEHGIALRVNPRRGSIGSDWNFALAASDTDLITLAHQDDTYAPRYVECMHEAIAGNQDVLIAFSDFVEHTAAGPRVTNLNVRVKRFLSARAFGSRLTIDSPSAKRRLLAFGNPICCPSVMIHRARLPEFRFIDTMTSNLDWEAWTRLSSQPGSFVYVRERLVSKMVHSASETSSSLAQNRRQSEDRLMFRRFWPVPIASTIATLYRLGYLANRV